MPVFTLTWDNAVVLASPNATAQRAGYRRKDVGGVWITTGFTPANDLPKSAITCLTPVLISNVVYEFRVQAICTVNGPTINSNGIREQIIFACISPSLSQSDVAATADINVTGTNITKAIFTLRKQSDNSAVGGPSTVVVSANHIQKTFTGLVSSTNYYWEIQLIAVVNGIEVNSSSVDYINAVCGPYNMTTTAPPNCPAPGILTISTVV